MAPTKKFSEPIPDRRRTRFAVNGGPRPTERQRRSAKRGLTAAREALEATIPGDPRHRVVRPMTAAQRKRAAHGLDQARQARSA